MTDAQAQYLVAQKINQLTQQMPPQPAQGYSGPSVSEILNNRQQDYNRQLNQRPNVNCQSRPNGYGGYDTNCG